MSVEFVRCDILNLSTGDPEAEEELQLRRLPRARRVARAPPRLGGGCCLPTSLSLRKVVRRGSPSPSQRRRKSPTRSDASSTCAVLPLRRILLL